MKKWVSIILAGLISFSITGCSLLVKEAKKEEAKQQPPKQEQSQQTKAQGQNTAKADSVLTDSKPLKVDSMTVYVDQRNWNPQPAKDGGYEMFPNASSFEKAFEGIFVQVEQMPFPRLDENGAETIMKEFLSSASSESGDVKFEKLKSESDEVMFHFQMKESGLVGEGFFRFFGNDQKSGIVVYLSMKNTSKEEMEKWQKRIEAATFNDSL